MGEDNRQYNKKVSQQKGNIKSTEKSLVLRKIMKKNSTLNMILLVACVFGILGSSMSLLLVSLAICLYLTVIPYGRRERFLTHCVASLDSGKIPQAIKSFEKAKKIKEDEITIEVEKIINSKKY